jgi:hypothetical protein
VAVAVAVGVDAGVLDAAASLAAGAASFFAAALFSDARESLR